MFNKILKVLRSVKRAYLDLREKYRNLLSRYNDLFKRHERSERRLEGVIAENRSLKEQVMDYGRIRRLIGPEKAEELLR
ncbi:hypothetical protein EI53_01431 [Fusobacterium naviforme]|nr:hypothetical protein F7P78_07625 [Fusobacterium naviforme]PSL09974.1 hypothetical protein EI53_01431 [Fusobacterium naviforme]STO27938.1 Uncharacterised protein [Fusobacterium naviforme]